MLGCKAKGASLELRASIATFEFRNRRRTKQSFVAVEGLDKRGVRDKRWVKPKAKQTRANRPCTAEKGNMEIDTSVQRNGSSDDCARDAVFNFPGDTAPTSDFTQCSTTGVEMGQKRKGGDDNEEAQVCKRIFIQPAETIPRTMRQRGDYKEPYQQQEKDHIQGEYGLGLTGGIVENIVVNTTSAIEQSMIELSATEQLGNGNMDIYVEGWNAEVSGVFSGKGDLALREPRAECKKATASFARAPDNSDEDSFVHTPRIKPILVEVQRFQTGARKGAAQTNVYPDVANPTRNVGSPDVAAGNPASIGGSPNDAAGQDTRVVVEANGVDEEAKDAQCSVHVSVASIPAAESTGQNQATDSELTRLWKEGEACTHENVRFDSEASNFADLDWSMLNVWDFLIQRTTLSMQRIICQRSWKSLELTGRRRRSETDAQMFYMPGAKFRHA